MLVNHDLIEVKDGQTLRHVVEPGPAYMDMLRERFDLDLGVPYEALGLPPAADAA